MMVRSLTPADGWFAVYANETTPDGLPCVSVPLVAFAAISRDADDNVEGLVPDGQEIIPAKSPTFLGYTRQSSGDAPELDQALQTYLAQREAEQTGEQDDDAAALMASIRSKALPS